MNTQIPSKSFSGLQSFLEHALILSQVTFLLGTAAVYSSRNSHHDTTYFNQKNKATSSFLKDVQQVFIDPYTAAWEEITKTPQVLVEQGQSFSNESLISFISSAVPFVPACTITR